jgi:hypothetical protein
MGTLGCEQAFGLASGRVSSKRTGAASGKNISPLPLTITVYDRVPVHPVLSVAVTVKLNVPAAVGVPVKPPPLAKFNPLGKLPVVLAKVYGAVPPVAVRVCEYGVPAKPFTKLAGFTVIAGHSGPIVSV